MSIYYDPNVLSYGSIATSDSLILSTKVQDDQITNDTDKTVFIGSGAGSTFTFRKQGDAPWLSTGDIEVSNLWKTTNEANPARYAAIDSRDDKIYTLLWSDDSATLQELDTDGAILQQETVDAFNHPFMHVYEDYVIVAHTDVTGAIGVVTRFLITDFSTFTSVDFLGAGITASTITGMKANTLHLTDEKGDIVVIGVTDHATDIHAVGVIGARAFLAFDIYSGLVEHQSVAMSSGMQGGSDMILCGQAGGGSKFTTLLYDAVSKFTTGVDSEMGHRFAGTDTWSMAYSDSLGSFYPTMSSGSGASVARFRQAMGGYSTNIESLYSTPLIVDSSNQWRFGFRFTGVIADGAATDLALFKDGASTTNYTLYVKASGELALEDSSSTEIWTTVESLDDIKYEGLGVSSDHIIEFYRYVDSSGIPTWVVSVNGGKMTVSLTTPAAVLDLGDRVELPVTGTYTGINCQFGADGVRMRFNTYSDMTICDFGTCPASTVDPAATVFQDYPIASTLLIRQSEIGQATEIIDGFAYVSGVQSSSGMIGRVNGDTQEWTVIPNSADGTSSLAGTAYYDDHIYVPYVSSGEPNTASIAIMTPEFVLDSFTVVEIRFLPVVVGVAEDYLSEHVNPEFPRVVLTGYGATVINLGATPYGIVTYGEGHRDYYSFSDTPETKNINTYVSGGGDYVYDQQASSFVLVSEGAGTHALVVKTLDLQEALLDYDAYIDTINVFYDVNSAKPIDYTNTRALVKYATSLMKSKLYFTPDSNYTFDEAEDNLWFHDLGDDTETGQIPEAFDANSDDTFFIGSKQVEIKDVPLSGRIGKAVKFRIRAYLGDDGEQKFDDFKIFTVNIIPSSSFNIGDSDA